MGAERELDSRWLFRIILLSAVYYLAGKFGLSLASLNASASAVWPPTGIALATLLLWGSETWPAVFLGALLVNITTQGSFGTSLGIAAGNTFEAVLGAWLVRRFAGGTKAFGRTQDTFKFTGLAAIVSTTASATFGVTSLCLGGLANWNQSGAIWLTWWLGDMVSNLIIAPLVLIWKTEGLPRLAPKQLLEAVLLLLTVTLTGGLLFLGKTVSSANHQPLGFLALPPLLWAAFRFGRRGAITASLLMSGIALWGTVHRFGPFVGAALNASLLFVQAFMGTSTLTALVLAVLLSERKQAEAILKESEERLKRTRDELARLNADLEHRVGERTAKLREVVAELEHFSYALVHDLRAPLRAMQSFAHLAEQRLGEAAPAEVMDYLLRIRAASGRMDGLVLDALNYNRAILDDPPLQPVELDELVSGIIRTYPNLQPPKAEVSIQGSLPVVLGNKAGLTQCFSNLLGNAVKFVAPGTEPRVKIWMEERNGSARAGNHRSIPNGSVVRIWIEDNGIGISKESHGRIFDMFQRAHAGYEGTGIGLAIVRKVAERMAGQVGVESEPGKGSRFWLELISSGQKNDQKTAPTFDPDR